MSQYIYFGSRNQIAAEQITVTLANYNAEPHRTFRMNSPDRAADANSRWISYPRGVR